MQIRLNDLDNHDGVVTHLEPDILECEVNWALGSIITNKPSGGEGIPPERFKISKDDTVKMLHSANLENSAVATGLENCKILVFLPIQRKAMPKNVQTNIQLCSFHMLAR